MKIKISLTLKNRLFTRKIKYDDRYLYHYVETLVFGNALFRATNPERIIIGKQSKSFRPSKKLINFLNNYNCEIIEMTDSGLAWLYQDKINYIEHQDVHVLNKEVANV